MSACTAYEPNNAPCPIPHETIAKSVCAKFPRGWAWDAVDIDGTNMNALAMAWAWVVKDVRDKACELLPEFVCDTASATVDEWNADYGLPDDCGINDICAKVAATGGADCGYFTDLASYLGYENVCCEDLPKGAMVGRWNIGCDPLAVGPTYLYGGSYLGYAGLACPGSPCGVDLGLGVHAGADDDCNIAGYYECEEPAAEVGNVCQTDGDCLEFVPATVGTLITGCYTETVLSWTGTSHLWRFGVPNDLTGLGEGGVPWSCDASAYVGDADWCLGFTPLTTFTPGTSGTPGNYSIVGCWDTGCTPLCAPPGPELFCFIEAYKPAHTVAVPYWCE